jgi:hypothetical protein
MRQKERSVRFVGSRTEALELMLKTTIVASKK